MALTLLAANNAQTVLAAGINATATTLTVNTGTGNLFPSPVSGTSFFKLTLVDSATGSLSEIVHVTSRSGDTMTIERAQEGTTARIWSANDIAANMLTAGSLQLYAQKDQSLLIENNLSEIADAGPDAVAQTLENLGLGTAAIRDVGAGENQIPDMSEWASGDGWRRTPDGYIEQWGTLLQDSNVTQTLLFPIPFLNKVENICLTETTQSTSTSNVSAWGFNKYTLTLSSVTVINSKTNTGEWLYWRAIGK
ncbi:gp53-like domain-containing protein [Citrobacter amalonaticus]|nr:hypothetical protein [Citrobacter amalonaticus]